MPGTQRPATTYTRSDPDLVHRLETRSTFFSPFSLLFSRYGFFFRSLPPFSVEGHVVHAPPLKFLAGRSVSRSHSGVGGGPDAGHATTSADKQRGGSQTHESQKQRICDQVLALFGLNKVAEQRFHDGSLLVIVLVIVRSRVWDFVISRSRSFPPCVAAETWFASVEPASVARNTMATPSS